MIRGFRPVVLTHYFAFVFFLFLLLLCSSWVLLFASDRHLRPHSLIRDTLHKIGIFIAQVGNFLIGRTTRLIYLTLRNKLISWKYQLERTDDSNWFETGVFNPRPTLYNQNWNTRIRILSLEFNFNHEWSWCSLHSKILDEIFRHVENILAEIYLHCHCLQPNIDLLNWYLKKVGILVKNLDVFSININNGLF